MKKIHYAWVVCAMCMLLIFCNMGLCNNGFSVWLQFAETKEGFTGGQGSSIMSVRCIFSLICMLFVTAYYKRLGVRLGAFIGTALSAAAYFVYSIGGSIYIYYIGAALAGIGYGFGTTIAISMMINNWFHRHRGLAMGISTAGTGVCAICFPPIMTRLIETAGLTVSFRVISVFVLLASVLVLLLAREHPQDIGMAAYGDGAEEEGKKIHKTAGTRNLKGAEWVFAAAALLLVGAVSTAGTGHFSIVMTSSGYSPEVAAAVFSFWGVVLIAAKFIYGSATDHFGCRRSTVAFYSLYVLGCGVSLLFFTESKLFAYLFALLIGLGIPPATVGFPIWAADLSTPEDYAHTVRTFQVFFLLGGVIFTSVPGLLYDKFGNYQSAYMMFAAFTVVSTTIISVLYGRRREKSTEKQTHVTAHSGH